MFRTQEKFIIDPDEELFKWCEKKANEIIKILGKGYRESVYHKSFCVELQNNNIPYESEIVLPIEYKGQQVGIGRSDVIVNKQLILEFKAIKKKIDQDEICQLRNYMTNTGINKGMVINFGRSNHVNDSEVEFIYVNNENLLIN